MVRTFLIALAVIAASACKGDGGPSAPAIVAGAPAGDVTEVAGDVKATRDGKTRALGKGDVVAGDDVIATGADGRVTIVLRHNQVPWSLGPNLTKKVGDSAAWTASKGAKPEDVTDDHSAAAGRHAERSATDTTASVGANAETDRQLAQAKDEAERARVQEQLEQVQKEQETERSPATSRRNADHKPAKCDPGDPLCDLDDTATPTAPGGGGDGEVRGALDPDSIKRVFRAHTADFKRCWETFSKTAPDAKGRLAIHLAIGSDGKVTTATVDGDAALEPMYECIRAAASKLVFPKPAGSIQISYPLVFSAP